MQRLALLVITLALLMAAYPTEAEVSLAPPGVLPGDPRDTLLLAAWTHGQDPDAVVALAQVPFASADLAGAYQRLLHALALPATPLPDGLPLPVATALVPIVDAMTHAVTLRSEAVAALTPADWSRLERLDATYRDSRLHDDRALLAAAWAEGGLPAGLDATRITAAAYTLLDAGLTHADALRLAGTSWPLPTTPTSSGLCVDDGIGVLIVCGPYDDLLTGIHILEIDLGGSDTHATNAGASGLPVVWSGTNGLPAALALDLYGHDTYTGGGQTQGTGSTTPGVLLDLDGFDTYGSDGHGFNFAQGAGNLGGVGILYDALGPDAYRVPRGAWDAQGFGILGGIGILHDASGNDHYQGGVMAQGVGDFDAVGILHDLEGDDGFEAVRKSQGFGDGAGLGLLLETVGYDAYLLWEDEGQGAGRGGLGVLLDTSGNDAYASLYGNAQGWGDEGPVWKPVNDVLGVLGVTMVGSGLVVDLEGDDEWHGSHGCDLCLWTAGTGVGLDTF